MKILIRHIFLGGLLAIQISSSQSMDQKGFKSSLFTYDNPTEAKGLHVTLGGEQWQGREIQEKDIPFYQDLFNNSEIMTKFASGQVRTPEQTETRIRNFWLPRYENGQPHSSLTVFTADFSTKIGHVVAGAGEAPGASEIAAAGLPTYWGQKIGTDGMDKIINIWGPEVRRIGLGNGLDELQDMKIFQAFQCFGGAPLARFDATASPSNPGSWKILDKFKFEPAAWMLNEDSVINLEQKEDMDAPSLETYLLSLFQDSEKPLLQSGVRYKMIEPNGTPRTFSKSDRFNCIKYHFERSVN